MFVIPQLSGGGAERVTAALAGDIGYRDGFEVHIAAYVRDPEMDYPVSGPVVWHCLTPGRKPWYRRIPEKIRFFRKTASTVAPDCVVSLGGPEVVTLLALALTGTGIPLCLSERNDPSRFPRQRHLRLLRNWAYRKCNGMVFQTQEAMDFFPAGIRRKGTVIPNPLTAELPERFAGVREPRIVAVCRLDPQKNLDLLIDAFSDLSKEYPNHALYIYGEGPERNRLERRICDMGLTETVILCGYSNNVYEDIRKASLYVSSSDYEGISNSMLEAIALGVPTICTDCPVGGARETIEHGVNGLLVPLRDRQKMVEAMRRVLSDDKLAEAISLEGTVLRESLSVHNIAGKWLDFIEQLE